MTTYSLDVPEAHYPAMLEHLLSLLRPTEAGAPAETQADAPAQPGQPTNAEAWEKAWPDFMDDTRKLMLLLAASPDEQVQIAALEESVGSFRRVQSALSSLTKQMKKHIGAPRWAD